MKTNSPVFWKASTRKLIKKCASWTKNKDPTLCPSGQKLETHAYEKTSLLAPRCSAEATIFSKGLEFVKVGAVRKTGHLLYT
jgi:hypothetical protein